MAGLKKARREAERKQALSDAMVINVSTPDVAGFRALKNQVAADLVAEKRFSFYRENYSECPLDEKPVRFGFKCPRGRGWCYGLLIAGATLSGGYVIKHQEGRPCWDWDQNREAPTFSPSINCLSHNPSNPSEKYAGCGWHGHIQKGVFNPPS